VAADEQGAAAAEANAVDVSAPDGDSDIGASPASDDGALPASDEDAAADVPSETSARETGGKERRDNERRHDQGKGHGKRHDHGGQREHRHRQR
jgi:hypothetical protein